MARLPSPLLLAALAALQLPLPAEAGAKCYGLALSGGGDKGAFEAGAIQGLVARLKPEERRWNVVTGISAGSILASAAALFELGNEVAMADFMVAQVANFTRSEVYRSWVGGPLQGVLFESGLFDTQPLDRTLRRILGSRRPAGRNITFGATSDESGEPVLFDEHSVAKGPQHWADCVRASCAIPGIFQSVKVDGKVLSDGGLVIGVDAFSAVARCRQLVERDEDIVLDVVTCDSYHLKKWDQKRDDKTLPLILRGLEEQRYNKQMSDILDACLAYPKVSFRYFVEPPPSGLPSNGLDFDRAAMEEMVVIGRKQASLAEPGAACRAAEARRNSAHWPAPGPERTMLV